jgi:hypothetical protein
MISYYTEKWPETRRLVVVVNAWPWHSNLRPVPCRPQGLRQSS